MQDPEPDAISGSPLEGDLLTSAELFTIVWDSLADVLGTAAVAALVRRAAGRAAHQHRELGELQIVRDELEYRYLVPASWSESAEAGPPALQALLAEVRRLLLELTGTVLHRRLEELPELRACELAWRAREAN